LAKIHPTAIVEPGCSLDDAVEVGPFCRIGKDVKIGRRTRLHSSVVIDGQTEIGRDNEIFPGAVIGVAPQDLRYKGEPSFVRIGNRNTIREYVTIHPASDPGGYTTVGDNNLIMAYVHIAHNCRLGNQISVANSVGLSGHVEVEDQATLGGMCGVHQFVRIGKMAMVGGMTKLIQDVPPFGLVDGQPARLYGLNERALQRNKVPLASRQSLKACFKLVTGSRLNLGQAIEAIRKTVEPCAETEHLLSFFQKPTTKGFCIRGVDTRRGVSDSIPEELADEMGFNED
jgi:UDP-N-acetylglucosamine acyltransferase